MNESLGSDSSPGGYGESDDSTGEKVFEYATEYGPTDLDELRELASSGALTGLGGAVTVLRGFQSLRRGETGRGLFRLATGVLLLALAVEQRRSRDEGSGGRGAGAGTAGIDQTDVAGSQTDLEDVSSGLDTSDRGPETGGDPAEVVDTGSDVEDVSSGLDDTERDRPGDTDPAEVVDTAPEVSAIDADSGTDVDADTAEDADNDADADEEAGVSTESGEVGVEETNAVDADEADDSR